MQWISTRHFSKINTNISLFHSITFDISRIFIFAGNHDGLPRVHLLLGPTHLGSPECPHWHCGLPWYTGSETILYCCISTLKCCCWECPLLHSLLFMQTHGRSKKKIYTSQDRTLQILKNSPPTFFLCKYKLFYIYLELYCEHTVLYPWISLNIKL